MIASHCLGLWDVSVFSTKMTTATVTSYHHSYLGPPSETTFSASVYAQQAMLISVHASLVEAVVDQKPQNAQPHSQVP